MPQHMSPKLKSTIIVIIAIIVLILVGFYILGLVSEAAHKSSETQTQGAAVSTSNPNGFWKTFGDGIGTVFPGFHNGIGSGNPSGGGVSTSGTPTNDGVSIQGSQLVRNGQPFIVGGLIIDGLDAPVSLLKSNGRQIQGYNAWGPAILQAAKSWHANTIRFNFSQAALDPQSSIYNVSNYLSEIQSAVKLARSMGFIVLVTDQDEGTSYDPNPPPVRMTTAATLRADLTLTQLFKNDTGVMIDLFNEPQLAHSPANWQLWLNGGVYQVNATTTEQIVGVQTIVNQMRAAGSKNVLVIDAITTTSFDGVPTNFTDPLNNYIYDTHLLDFTNIKNTQAEWQTNFGFLVDEGKPVLIGAFDARSTNPNGPTTSKWWCMQPGGLSLPSEFLNYIAQKKVGVIGFAFDVPHTIVTDFKGTPTSFVGRQCGDPDAGSGDLLQAQFAKATPAAS